MLTLKALAYQYNQEAAIEYPDWEVKKEEHALILGNSGSGKTTLLHLIGALKKPTKGEISIDDVALSEMLPAQLDRFRGENIGIIFQQPHLIKSLTVKENVLLAQHLGKKKADKQKVENVLEQLDILSLKNRKVHEISQGQAQRVSIARAVVNQPKLLLADEPTASLDDNSCTTAIGLLKEQAEQWGTTLVIATHDQRVKSEFENRLAL